VSEQESLVLKLLRKPPPTASTAPAREQARARARAALGETERARFEAVLEIAERVHPQREENVLYTQSLPMGLVRRALLEIGRRLVAAGGRGGGPRRDRGVRTDRQGPAGASP
jgi:hypothetical protein